VGIAAISRKAWLVSPGGVVMGYALLLAFVTAVRTIGGEMIWTTGIVLVVDTEDEVPETLKTALQYTDYVVVQAKDGEEALAVLSRFKSQIDLTIIDLELPNGDGLVISLLAILAHRNTAKVIIKTSRQDEPFLEQVSYLGADAIVFKPISEDQFIKTVQARLTGCRTVLAGASAGGA
jgi:DNA-binding response OmpR family regulator